MTTKDEDDGDRSAPEASRSNTPSQPSPAYQGTPVPSASLGPYAAGKTSIRAGEITAYRAWTVRNNKLYSLFFTKFEWHPNLPAHGDPTRVLIPLIPDADGMFLPNCEGIHAFKTEEQCREYIKGWFVEYLEPCYIVWGEVQLWGTVIEHELGYRAEWGKPLRITGGDGPINKINRKYCGKENLYKKMLRKLGL